MNDQGINGNLFSDTRVDEFLYDGALSVAGLLEQLDEDLLITQQSVSVAATATDIVTITNLGKLISVINSSLPYQQIDVISVREFPKYREAYSCSSKPAVAIVNNTIRYFEAFGAAHTVEVTYTQVLQDLSADTEEWDLPEFSQRLIPYEAALIGLAAENSDIRAMTQLTADLRRQVTQYFEGRGRTTPQYVEPDDGRY